MNIIIPMVFETLIDIIFTEIIKIGTIFTAIFIAFKIANVIDWDWVWVFSPAWISVVIFIVLAAIDAYIL